MKLSNSISKAIFAVAFISILFAFLVSIISQYSNFQKDIKHIKNKYIEMNKENIKREVLKVHYYITAKELQIESEIKEKLKKRIDLAYTIANSIYYDSKNSKTDEEIQYLIVTALKNLSFSENRAYFFINSNKGRAILFNKELKLNENKDVWDLKDINGHYIVRKQANLVKEKKEGFTKNYFIKPDLKDNIQYPKLTYVKLFEPYDWHIGIGEYIDDMEKNIKNEILKGISTIRFGEEGYIFVNSLKRQALVFDGKKLPKAKYYSNDELFSKQLKALETKADGFFSYEFKKLNTTKKFPKIAFVKEYRKWGWIIGSGVYIDKIDEEITRQERKLKETILNQMTFILSILILLIISIYFISEKITSYIDNNIKDLIESFTKAAIDHKEMKTEELTYKEFKVLAKSLNETLRSRNETEGKLEDYIKIVNENVIISSTNKDGIITNASEAFCKISGYSKDELLGKSHSIVRHPFMDNDFYTQMWKNLKEGESWEGEIKNRNKQGSSYWVHTIIQPKFENKQIVGYTAIRHDISNKKRVEYLSITDELTKLYNRRHFNKTIDDEIKRAKRDDHYLSFIMVDIDYFKKYNDTYGHQAGDLALEKVAEVLKSHTNRVSDFAFRLGGEEFGILFSLENEKKSLEFANLIRTDIEKIAMKHKTSEISQFVTTSIGLVVKRGSQIKNSNSLYKLADEALYEAKKEGRNRVVLSK